MDEKKDTCEQLVDAGEGISPHESINSETKTYSVKDLYAKGKTVVSNSIQSGEAKTIIKELQENICRILNYPCEVLVSLFSSFLLGKQALRVYYFVCITTILASAVSSVLLQTFIPLMLSVIFCVLWICLMKVLQAYTRNISFQDKQATQYDELDEFID